MNITGSLSINVPAFQMHVFTLSLQNICLYGRMNIRKVPMTGVAASFPILHREGGGAYDGLRNRNGYFRDIGLAHILRRLCDCTNRLFR